MNTWALVWLVIYTGAALLFFGTAVVITIIGVRDLRDLLTPAEPANRNTGSDPSDNPDATA